MRFVLQQRSRSGSGGLGVAFRPPPQPGQAGAATLGARFGWALIWATAFGLGGLIAIDQLIRTPTDVGATAAMVEPASDDASGSSAPATRANPAALLGVIGGRSSAALEAVSPAPVRRTPRIEPLPANPDDTPRL
jgi:hypothetical protein